MPDMTTNTEPPAKSKCSKCGAEQPYDEGSPAEFFANGGYDFSEPLADVAEAAKALAHVEGFHHDERPTHVTIETDLFEQMLSLRDAALSAQPAPSQSGLAQAKGLKVVALQLSKRIASGSTQSMTMHWGEYETDQAAIGAAVLVAQEAKPDFSIDQTLVCTPYAKSLHTNNQPAPDDGLVGRWEIGEAPDGRAYLQGPFSPHDARLYLDGDFFDPDDRKKYLESILSALTVKDHTALAETLNTELQIGDFQRAWDKCDSLPAMTFTESEEADLLEALATKGGGE